MSIQTAAPMTVKQTSHCCFCSMQCGMELVPGDDKPGLTIRPSPIFPVATNRLCQKGLNALDHVIHEERIMTPLRRPVVTNAAEGKRGSVDPNSAWEPAAWDEALPEIAERIRDIQHRYGKDAVSVYGGGSLTNEVCYLLGKFARVALKTRYIDYNGRYCMSSAAAAAGQSFGLDRGMTMPLSEIKNAKYILLAGTNIAECQPTMMPYLLEAKKNGAIIVTIDPRNTMTSKSADIHVRLQPGFDSVFVNGLLHVMIHENLYDRTFVNERTHGFAELAAAVETFTPAKVEEWTGILESVTRTIARGFAKAETGIVLTARGLEQQSNGVENTKNYINLALLTGKIGRPGCGYGAVTGQANGQGGREHGQKADQLPGYRSIEDPAAREHIGNVWGIDPAELPGKGVSAYEMLQKIDEGEIKAMIVIGSNPVVSSPNNRMVERALGKLELLIVVDLFETETARYAHWLLPGSSFLEAEGTLTNLEGRVFHRAQAMEPPGECKPDYCLICELAEQLGEGAYFRYASAEHIFEEMRRATAGGKADYSGITYRRLKEEQGVFWPCPADNHPGSPLLFADRFAHPDGKARLFGIQPKMPAEPIDEEYPYILTTGRVGSHYLSGAQTRRTSALMKKTPVPVAEIHPWLAKRIGLGVGDFIRITSRRASLVFSVKVTEGIQPRTVFVPFHWGGELSVNRLTIDALDPVSRMPEFKLCAVKIEAFKQEAN
ncbi:molybdopterin oxidoreductase family protein [Paenibacillus allorhizosphaerae]|uniref:Assimilatory nitrate reductase catalytic subunit n=1 Tax=Paenibacillus allorhizosphaerae TaxID=2849866 RepID=A0ABM8VDK3_9BACL|nr:molybdopterin oxidoreductase family protein [Paenibacillus allorhizosphaerae]CAG7628090.1 Assimilatory nitrate reductase catalytic subunit [Paenibacillus allorhizosphaerae]